MRADDRRFRRLPGGPGRRRARRAGAIRRARAGAAGGAILAAAAAAGVRAVAASRAFEVRQIVVRGHERLARNDVVALVDGLQGRHLLAVDLAEWQARVLRSPWVAAAELRRVLPDTIEIAIRERRPLAAARFGGRLRLVDETGTIIDDLGPEHADLDLPIVDGLEAPAAGEAAGGEAGGHAPVDPARLRLAARLLAALADRAPLWRRLSQIDVSDARNAVVMLKDDGARLHLGGTAFADRLQAYLELRPALVARVPAIDYVDLRFEPRVFVRPAGGAPGVVPAGEPAGRP
jgi:cell division septal protein FtsQ